MTLATEVGHTFQDVEEALDREVTRLRMLTELWERHAAPRETPLAQDIQSSCDSIDHWISELVRLRNAAEELINGEED